MELIVLMQKRYRLLISIISISIAMLACGYQSVLRFNGHSMSPTIVHGQKLFTEAVDLSDLKRGDIVYFDFNGASLVKRVIGLPGEKIEIRDGNIYIDDSILVEDYDASSPQYVVRSLTLKVNEYFVLGDNRNDSKDSHQFGPITGDQIMGRVFLIQ